VIDMAVARNEEELEDFGADDQATKIRLEPIYFRSVKPFLRKINKDFEQQYIATETVVDAQDYNDELSALLFALYLKTSKKYKFNIRESFTEKVSPRVDAEINVALKNRLDELKKLESKLILDTTNKQIAKELSNTIGDFVGEGIEIDSVEIAKQTRKALDDKVDGRAGNIATSENA